MEVYVIPEDPIDNTFSNKNVRRAFVKKVYGILSVQLLFTFGIVVMATQVEEMNNFARKYPYLAFISIIIALVLSMVIMCNPGLARTTPINYILLGAYTIAEAATLFFITAQYNKDTVLIAVLLTVAITILLTLFAFQTAIDFTAYTGIMFVVLICFVGFTFILLFFRTIPILHTIVSVFGALIFSMFIIIDTQMIMDGKHQEQFSPEDYILAVLCLYIDVTRLFIYMLNIVDSMNRSDR